MNLFNKYLIKFSIKKIILLLTLWAVSAFYCVVRSPGTRSSILLVFFYGAGRFSKPAAYEIRSRSVRPEHRAWFIYILAMSSYNITPDSRFRHRPGWARIRYVYLNPDKTPRNGTLCIGDRFATNCPRRVYNKFTITWLSYTFVWGRLLRVRRIERWMK